MKRIAVTQRVSFIEQYKEVRDCLDQMWYKFMISCDFLPVILPNEVEITKKIFKNNNIDGILLTGGNDLLKYGGKASNRDETEQYCLNYSMKNNLPLIGVCRGMQLIQDFFGVELKRVDGHVQKKQGIIVNGQKKMVNSYHNFGTVETIDELLVWAKADDGVIKAVKHKNYNLYGIMWHPERMYPFRGDDIKLFKEIFK